MPYAKGMTFNPFKREKLNDLVEEVLCESSTLKIDRENHVIRGVKILGRQSKNGYEYTDSAMDQAAPLYEGIDVAIDHDRSNINRERSILESPGVLRNSHRRADGVFGDFEYLDSHPATPMLLERIERGMPIGLSHNARGGFPVTRNGKRFVESVRIVKGVDLVLKPATTANLFESESDTVSTTVKDILGDKAPAYAKLATLIEGVIGDESLSAVQVELAADATANDQIKGAMAAIVESVISDSKLDPEATYEKLAGLFAGKKAPEPKHDADLQESLAPLQESIRKLTHDKLVRDVLEKFGATRTSIGDERYTLLESQKDESGMSKLIESWPPAVRGAAKPATGINTDQPTKKTPRLINARR